MHVARSSERGVAFVETMLIMSFALLLMYSIVQTGLTAYSQVSADGATFVGTHTAVQYDPDGTGNAATVAAQVANSVFQGIGATTVAVLHPTSTTFETDVKVGNGNFSLTGPGSSTTSRQIDTAADPGDDTQTVTFPPTSVTCVTNKVALPTGTITNGPIATFGTGSLTTVTTTASNAISGSLSITPTGVNSTVVTTIETPITTVTSDTTIVSNDLTQINATIAALENNTGLGGLTAILSTPLGPIVTGKLGISGTILNDAPVSTTTVIGALSGATGLVADAADGVLTSGQVTTVQAELVAAQTAVNALTGLVPAGDLAPLNNLISELSGIIAPLENLNGAVEAVNAVNAAVAGQTCQ